MSNTGESGRLTREEALEEAYITDNILASEKLIDGEIEAQRASLSQPHTSEIHVQAEINRLEAMKAPVAIIINLFEVEEPIDLKFVLELGEFMDAAAADFDVSGETPEEDAEIASITTSLEYLRARNQEAVEETVEGYPRTILIGPSLFSLVPISEEVDPREKGVMTRFGPSGARFYRVKSRAEH